jgi:hypothetical protein
MDFSTRLLDLERRLGLLETIEIPSASSVQGFTQGSVLFANASGQITQNNSKLFWDNTKEFLVVGSNATTLEGQSRFTIRGTNADGEAGPHFATYTNSDAYPLMHFLSYQHDNMEISFDSYYDSAAALWKSSDAGSNFQIRKNADQFSIWHNTGTALGGTISWKQGLGIAGSNGAGFSILNDAEDNAAVIGFSFYHRTSATPAASFGHSIRWNLDSSTTGDQVAAQINTYWVTATHASRAARQDFYVYDVGTARLCMSIEAAGVPQFAVLGAAPIARQTGGAKTADLAYGPDERDMLNIAYNALRNFGFLT